MLKTCSRDLQLETVFHALWLRMQRLRMNLPLCLQPVSCFPFNFNFHCSHVFLPSLLGVLCALFEPSRSQNFPCVLCSACLKCTARRSSRPTWLRATCTNTASTQTSSPSSSSCSRSSRRRCPLRIRRTLQTLELRLRLALIIRRFFCLLDRGTLLLPSILLLFVSFALCCALIRFRSRNSGAARR